jgi:DNA-binding NarL/FixJ family response regulator
MIKVLIADDHPLLIDGLVRNITDKFIEVVGETRHSNEVPVLYRKLNPDVVITDVMFGEGEKTGIDILTELLIMDSKAKVVMFSQYDSVELIKDSYSRGAKAYIPKSLEVDFGEIIKKVAAGQKYFDPSIATKLAELSLRDAKDPGSPISLLSPSELQAFKLVAEGFTQKEAADRMGSSLRTVAKLFNSIREKLDVERPADITILAIQNNLIDINNISRRGSDDDR